MNYKTENNVIYVNRLKLEDLLSLLATIHHITNGKGFSYFTLDFTNCSMIHPAAALALCPYSCKLRNNNIDIELILPKNKSRQKLFENCNWAYFIDPKNHSIKNKKGKQIPATQYKSPKEQDDIVKSIVEKILISIDKLDRKDFGAFEWALNEITDNVLTHSSSVVGGFVQVSILNDTKILLAVADAGLGIPDTIKYAYPNKTDIEAIELAISEGVTRDSRLGQGNGLYGSHKICSASNGLFWIVSNHGQLSWEGEKSIFKNNTIPYEGTLIVAEIDFSNPNLLSNALSFKSGIHTPLDYIERTYEDWHPDSELATFKMKNESESFGSRVAGTPVRKKLIKVAQMCPEAQINIDFSDVAIMSSSFADEVIAKLYCEIGLMTFMSRFKIISANSLIKDLIDKAITQRTKTN